MLLEQGLPRGRNSSVRPLFLVPDAPGRRFIKLRSGQQLDDAGTTKGFYFPCALQESNLNALMRVLQLKLPVVL
jgi:hypothetical protein